MLSAWDLALIVSVSLMGTLVAYIRNPEYKAFILMLPVPFSLAFLALGRSLDATNLLAMLLMFGFWILTWLLHSRFRFPIALTIPVCAGVYSIAGAAIASVWPPIPWLFWTVAGGAFLAAVVMIAWLPYREEPFHRTPLPLWIKLPLIMMVVTGVVLLKQYLGGFMTMFPMVGVVAAYESRKSLWTVVRRMPWLIVMMTPALAAMRLIQDPFGHYVALAACWAVYLPLLWVLQPYYHRDVVLSVADAAGNGAG